MFFRKEKSVKKILKKTKNSLKVAKKKARLQIATYKNSSFSFDAFIFFIYLPEVLKLKIIREK